MTISLTAVQSACAYADRWLAFRQRYLRVPGVQVAVLYDDGVVFSKAYGYADAESQTTLTPRHLFRIASHSKTFTGTAVFQLVEAGKLRLDDPIGQHVPWIKDASPAVAAVTVRELLSHSGGVIRDSNDGDFWQLWKPFPDEDSLRARLDADSAIYPANERFKYSNIGYSLLGQVVAAASASSYNSYVTTNIVDRLGLTDTAPELDLGRLGDYATGYSALSYRDDRLPIDHVDTRAMSAAAGFSSTAGDLVRYVAAHFYGDTRLISDGSKRVMQREEWRVDESAGTAYGLGMASAKVGERRMIGHGGGYPGHSTRTMFDPQDKLAVSVLTNAIDGPPEELASGIVKLIDLAAKSENDDPTLDRFCGRFANLWGVLDVARFGDKLYGISPTQADPTDHPTELAVESDDTLRVTESLGYGAPGERFHYDFETEAVRMVRGGGGMTVYPIERYAETLDGLDRVRQPRLES